MKNKPIEPTQARTKAFEEFVARYTQLHQALSKQKEYRPRTCSLEYWDVAHFNEYILNKENMLELVQEDLDHNEFYIFTLEKAAA